QGAPERRSESRSTGRIPAPTGGTALRREQRRTTRRAQRRSSADSPQPTSAHRVSSWLCAAPGGAVARARPNSQFSRLRVEHDADVVIGAVTIGRHITDGVAAANLTRDPVADAEQVAWRMG